LAILLSENLGLVETFAKEKARGLGMGLGWLESTRLGLAR
jgi:hypothetical protein